MFIKSALVSLVLAAAAIATPLRRADTIKVAVVPSAPSTSLEALKFTATVTNTGSEAVKILKYGTILDEKLPTKSFEVTKDGASVPFTGIRLSVSLTDADDSAYTVIPAGETITVSHDVSSLYDFSSLGEGKFTFAPKTNFLIVDTDASAKKTAEEPTSFAKVQVESEAVDVEITGDLSKRELKALESRAVSVCSNSSRKSFIDASYSEAKTLARAGTSWINSRGSGDSVYRAYFGSNTVSRVTSILNAVANESSSSRTLSCTDTYGACSSGVIAYTLIASTNIYYCSIFFNEVSTSSLCSGTTVASRNVRGGTTLHELTHAVGGTDDVTYGCSADQGLSDSNKLRNADNFNSALVSLVLAAAAIATPLRRADTIKVAVVPSAPSTSLDALKFTATVTNTGSEAVKILKYGTILDEKLPTKSFEVTKDGASVPFTGIRLSVSLTDADDSAYTVIPAGETIIVSHDVSSLYDFSSLGEGKFTFAPKTNFLVVDTDASAKKTAEEPTSFANVHVESQAVDVQITGDLSKRELKALESRATSVCSFTSQKAFIDAAYAEAKILARSGISWIDSRGASDSVYRAYFGSNTVSRVTSILDAVANENSRSRTLSCTDTYGSCVSGVIAYTNSASTNIYFCSAFFNQVPIDQLCNGTTVASRNVRGGTVLHELTHAVSGTDDVIYGCPADQGLSDSNKLRNADNFYVRTIPSDLLILFKTHRLYSASQPKPTNPPDAKRLAPNE
ncbi:hypothetical protein CVT24_000153 [Panaeolus cyanescens]|uniref:Neutral protease 2 n=1 Tax=Panaeolus cyanescens TaxID=181874 RepID=A0A409VIX5_9AGAR|nr:hypothetical protein CVT24_000153 [Panaeolus cyanescens]